MLALVRELREPSSTDEVADFETDVLAGFDEGLGSPTVTTPRQSHGAVRNQMPKLSLSEARRRPATAMMSFSSWQSAMMAK